MKKLGISLILLVITIIVITLLAGSVVISLLQNNPINKANESKVMNDLDIFKNELTIYISKEYLDTNGSFNISELNANTTTNPNIYDVISSIDGKKYGDILYVDILEVQSGKLVLKDSVLDETIIGWAQNLDITKKEIDKIESTSALWEFDLPTRTITGYLGSDIDILTTITIPNYIDGIPVDSVMGLEEDKSVLGYIPYGVELSEVIISDGIKVIGNSAFYNLPSLTNIVIPDSVTTIGKYAFSACTYLENITIPNSVTNIEQEAFYYCISLLSITIPQSATSVHTWAFDECYSMVDINVDPNNDVYSSIDGVLFNKAQTTLLRYPPGRTGELAYAIPEGVTIVGNSAFWGGGNLFELTIPTGVTTIESWAFGDCINLVNLALPDSVTTIQNSVFQDCSSLISIDVSESNTAFSSSNGVIFNKDKTTLIAYPAGKNESTYIIPNGVNTLEASAFENCVNLTSITIPDGMLDLKPYSFAECNGLTSITIPSTVQTIGTYAFYRCYDLLDITINKISGSITGSPWGAPEASVSWTS